MQGAPDLAADTNGMASSIQQPHPEIQQPQGGNGMRGPAATQQHGGSQPVERSRSPGPHHHAAIFCRRKHSAPNLCLRPVAPSAPAPSAAGGPTPSGSSRRQRAAAADAVLALRKAPFKLHRRVAHLMMAAAAASAGSSRPAVAAAAARQATGDSQAPSGQARLLSISSSSSTAGLVAAMDAVLRPRRPAEQQAAAEQPFATATVHRLPGSALPLTDGQSVHACTAELQVPQTPSHSSQSQLTGHLQDAKLQREQSIRSAPPAAAASPSAPVDAPLVPAASPPLHTVILAVELLLRLAATKVSTALAHKLAEDVTVAVAAASAAALAGGNQFDLATELLGVVPVLQQTVVAAWCKAQASDAAAATAVVAALLQQPGPGSDEAQRQEL